MIELSILRGNDDTKEFLLPHLRKYFKNRSLEQTAKHIHDVRALQFDHQWLRFESDVPEIKIPVQNSFKRYLEYENSNDIAQYNHPLLSKVVKLFEEGRFSKLFISILTMTYWHKVLLELDHHGKTCEMHFIPFRILIYRLFYRKEKKCWEYGGVTHFQVFSRDNMHV